MIIFDFIKLALIATIGLFSAREAYRGFVQKKCIDFGRRRGRIVTGEKAIKSARWYLFMLLLMILASTSLIKGN
jgi:hypothetical protein